MKKLLIVVILLCLIFGSNNYEELNNLAIITNIGIEKVDNKYKVIFQEILPKIEENKIVKSYTYYTNNSDDLVHAFKSFSDDITKEIYLQHLENIIIKRDDIDVINELSNVIKGDLDNFNIILSESDLKKVMSYRNNYKYVNKVIDNNISYRTIKKNKLESRKTKIPIVRISNNRLVFYKYVKLGDSK